ncbi:MAG: MBOAT family protein [Oscillospiraceae bacterium]|nr:MBOAT family protein [Oscillospiraceae bacterium]
MVFSSVFFLFTYLPIVLFAYYITPLRWRNAVLLLVNLIFYGWGEPVYICIMFASIAIDYTHGMLVDKCKRKGNDKGARMAVASSVFFNLALLFFFKYWNFIAGSLANVGLTFMPIIKTLTLPGGYSIPFTLPIGISFYTFQTMSYTIDVYRGDAKAQRSILNFGTFVTLFPQLIAGPIIKYKDLGDQIDHRDHTVDRFASGVQTFVVGMAKKVLLANNLGMLWDAYKVVPVGELTTLGAWLGILAFSFQLYFDFSGYSDMAIGLGRMLGFEFGKNFDYPYISRSLTEFWRRWHISLGSWFREYLYIPLGGNRVSKPRLLFNLMVVWAATGIWHGASWNFLLWGLYYGVLLVVEKFFLKKYLDRAPTFVCHVYALFFIAIGWALFAVEDLARLGPYLKAMLGFAGGGALNGAALYYLRSYLPMLVIAAVSSTPFGKNLWDKLGEKPRKVLLPILLMAGLLICTCYLVDATYNPFLYFRF